MKLLLTLSLVALSTATPWQDGYRKLGKLYRIEDSKSNESIASRQVPYFLTPITSNEVKQAVTLKNLKAEIDDSAKREMKMWGPFKLPAKNATHGAVGLSNGIKLDKNSDVLSGKISPPCQDCTVLKAVANLAYKNGTQADVGSGVYIHHIIITQTGRVQITNPVLPTGCLTGALNSLVGSVAGLFGLGKGSKTTKRQLSTPRGAVFVGGGGSVGSGDSFAVRDSKVKSGIYISKTDEFLFSAEVVNYDPAEKDVYVTVDFEWVPSKAEKQLNVGMGAFGLDCSSWEFQPPKDKPITYTGLNWTVTENGYFVNFQPHVHDGAVNMKVWLNEKQICESKVLYGAGDGAKKVGEKTWETITGYTPCAYMIEFKVGDQVRMTADYDLTKYSLRPFSHDANMGADGMAMATFIWAKK